MTSVVIVVVVLILVWIALNYVRRHQSTLVPRRGTSVGADLGVLLDQARVRVSELAVAGPDRVHVVLTPDLDGPAASAPTDLDLVVSLSGGDSELELLRTWQRAATSLAIVIPPGSHLVRLRSVEDLQPVTLRRIDPS